MALSALLAERIISFNLRLIASWSWVFWIRNTMRKVAMVVPRLITSCHAPEKRKEALSLPTAPPLRVATMKSHREPQTPDAVQANFVNQPGRGLFRVSGYVPA
jgi:hypothetical protein